MWISVQILKSTLEEGRGNFRSSGRLLCQMRGDFTCEGFRWPCPEHFCCCGMMQAGQHPLLPGVGSPFGVASSNWAPLHLARAVSDPYFAPHRQMDLDWQSKKTVILKLPLSCSIKGWKEGRSQRPETDHLAILPRGRSWSSSCWYTCGGVNGLLLCVHFAC